ncbi:MAG: TldD/PmbA family protein [Micromonosporaceae bacterium]|nr:TldD/PmbA family protein [Micromonosporaceae bacterium]
MSSGALTEQVLDLVARRAPGAEVEVTAHTQTLALTRFANSYIHQNISDTTTAVRLRLHVDGRTASGATTVTGGDGLGNLVERTLAAARLLPADPGWPGLTPPTAPSSPGNYDPATAEAEPAARAKAVRDFVDGAHGLTAAGYCRTTGVTASFANSAGHRVDGAVSSAAVDAIARDGGADGVARFAGPRLADVNGAALGAAAAAKASASDSPIDLPPGRYEVVLEPSAVVDLVSNLAIWGYNGKAVAEQRSFVELGVRQLDPSLTLVTDAAGPESLDLPFDAEGTPGRPVELARDGVSLAVAHDRRTAKETGAVSTGHAMPLGFRFGPMPIGARLSPGDAPLAETAGRPACDDSVAGLLGGMRRGLLVTDLWYTRVLDPRSLVETGLTRNGVWLVEDGEIVGPVSNLRFTQSYPQALGPGQVRAVGAVASAVPYHWGLLTFAAPALHLASWNFTGGAGG